MNNLVKPVYFIGDIHGYWDALFSRLKHFDIRDCYLICVGDLGIGFTENLPKEIRTHARINEFVSRRNIHMLSIRGNHDDPKFFDDRKGIEYTHFRLLPDYHTEVINGERFLFVGGAISIDRVARTPHPTVRTGAYWPNEKLVFDSNKIADCDILVTHSAPPWIGPSDKAGISGWEKRDKIAFPKYDLWKECQDERNNIQRLIEISKPKYHYCGHFHESFVSEAYGCKSTILAELEIKEHYSK